MHISKNMFSLAVCPMLFTWLPTLLCDFQLEIQVGRGTQQTFTDIQPSQSSLVVSNKLEKGKERSSPDQMQASQSLFSSCN